MHVTLDAKKSLWVIHQQPGNRISASTTPGRPLTCLPQSAVSATALPQNRLIWLLPCRMVVAVAPLHSFATPSSRATSSAVWTGPCRVFQWVHPQPASQPARKRGNSTPVGCRGLPRRHPASAAPLPLAPSAGLLPPGPPASQCHFESGESSWSAAPHPILEQGLIGAPLLLQPGLDHLKRGDDQQRLCHASPQPRSQARSVGQLAVLRSRRGGTRVVGNRALHDLTYGSSGAPGRRCLALHGHTVPLHFPTALGFTSPRMSSRKKALLPMRSAYLSVSCPQKGVSPFHSARTPSSLPIVLPACTMPGGGV